jgi:hypothetical protein
MLVLTPGLMVLPGGDMSTSMLVLDFGWRFGVGASGINAITLATQ